MGVVELEGDIWFEPIESFIQRKCAETWTKYKCRKQDHGLSMEHPHKKRDTKKAGRLITSVSCMKTKAQRSTVCTNVKVGGEVRNEMKYEKRM